MWLCTCGVCSLCGVGIRGVYVVCACVCVCVCMCVVCVWCVVCVMCMWYVCVVHVHVWSAYARTVCVGVDAGPSSVLAYLCGGVPGEGGLTRSDAVEGRCSRTHSISSLLTTISKSRMYKEVNEQVFPFLYRTFCKDNNTD